MAGIYLQTLFGLQCNDFVMLAADQTNLKGILVMKHDDEKLHNISDKILIGIIGEEADAVQFINFISKNMELYKIRNGYQLDTPAAVHFMRKNLMEALRSDSPSMVNMLVCGYSEQEGAVLYTMDFLASCVQVPFAVQGFGGVLSLGILDRYHKPTLTQSEGYDIMKLCVREIHQRLFQNLPNFQVKVISKDGIKNLPTISPASLAAT